MAGPFPVDTRFDSLKLDQVKWTLHRAWNKSFGGPRAVEGLYSPKTTSGPAAWMGRATIVADHACQATATLNITTDTGFDEVALLINGQRVLSTNWANAQIDLRPGENSLVLWVKQKAQGASGNNLYFRLGTPLFNYPLLTGVYYQTQDGKIPVNQPGATTGQ
jgi:hypothetical protein